MKANLRKILSIVSIITVFAIAVFLIMYFLQPPKENYSDLSDGEKSELAFAAAKQQQQESFQDVSEEDADMIKDALGVKN